MLNLPMPMTRVAVELSTDLLCQMGVLLRVPADADLSGLVLSIRQHLAEALAQQQTLQQALVCSAWMAEIRKGGALPPDLLKAAAADMELPLYEAAATHCRRLDAAIPNAGEEVLVLAPLAPDTVLISMHSENPILQLNWLSQHVAQFREDISVYVPRMSQEGQVSLVEAFRACADVQAVALATAPSLLGEEALARLIGRLQSAAWQQLAATAGVPVDVSAEDVQATVLTLHARYASVN